MNNKPDVTTDFERGKPTNTVRNVTPTEVEELIGEVGSKNEIYVELIASGPAGKDGLDTYQMWLKEGNEGTLDDFFNSLKGADGASYIHPDTHSADIIDETPERVFISAEEKSRLSGYIYTQIAAEKVWHITHNLNKFPSVSIVDTGGNIVVGNVEYVSNSGLMVVFSHPFSGKAYLN